MIIGEVQKVPHLKSAIKREIDFILESRETLIGMEVKAGEAERKADFKHIIWFGSKAVKGKRFLGLILYSGSEVLSFGKGLWALPTTMLWA